MVTVGARTLGLPPSLKTTSAVLNATVTTGEVSGLITMERPVVVCYWGPPRPKVDSAKVLSLGGLSLPAAWLNAAASVPPSV